MCRTYSNYYYYYGIIAIMILTANNALYILVRQATPITVSSCVKTQHPKLTLTVNSLRKG